MAGGFFSLLAFIYRLIFFKPPNVDGEAAGGLLVDDGDEEDMDDGDMVDGEGRAGDDDDAEIFSTVDGYVCYI